MAHRQWFLSSQLRPWLLAGAVLASTPGFAIAQSPVTSLRLEADHFVVNGQARFLFMVSYFDGLRHPDPSGDFAYLASNGIDGVRIFANWHHCTGSGPDCSPADDTLFDSSGNIQEYRWAKLLDVLNKARNAGLVVDLTFARDCVAGGLSVDHFKSAVEATAVRLRDNGVVNVFIDIQNEHNVTIDARLLQEQDVKDIADYIHGIDPNRFVTASFTGDYNTDTQAADMRSSQHLDITAFHDNRASGWQDRTAGVVNDIWWEDPWHPVYLQEPQRFDRDAVPDHYITAAYYAKRYGAMGWTFHNSTTFNLSGGWPRAAGESQVIERVPNESRPVDWSACGFTMDRPSQVIGLGGGYISVTLSPRWICSWTALNNGLGWITFVSATSGTNNGNNVITFYVSPSGGARTGVLSIGPFPFTVYQQ
jgi:hypothetical protein